MQLNLATLLTAALALAGPAAADKMTVQKYCFFGCTHTGTFKTSQGSYSVNAGNGCRKTSVPAMTEFCVDTKKERVHFRFKGQKDKRCMKQKKHEFKQCSDDFQAATCSTLYYEEVKCTW